MNRNLAKILAVTTLIITSAGLSTASQKQETKAFQTSSKNQQSETTQIASATSCKGKDLSKLHMTYYSHHDNTYPGNPNPNYNIAYSSKDYPDNSKLIYKDGADNKGGNGSFGSPIIAAVPPHLEECLSPGTRIYAPHLKKYLIIADKCPTSKDPNNPNEEKCIPGKNMIDVWMYTKPENVTSKVEECHNKWTGKGFEQPWDVVINPPNSKPVDTTPFFNPNTNECTKPNFS
jgi:hypothetical protein